MELGTVLEGGFVVTARHSSGRFSEVFRGTTLGTGPASVAVKVLKEKLEDSLYRETFEREVAALKMLRHENVVQFLGSGVTADGFPYLVTAFCEHPVLPRLKWDVSAVEFVESLLFAVQQAHALGIVHRDLKPQHLLRIDLNGPLKVIDFGIATIRGRNPTGVTLASHYTSGYACDEQILGAASRPQFDLYAVAACALWYLSGSSPKAERPLSEQLSDNSLAIPSSFRQLLVKMTDVNDLAMTSGVALRQLQSMSKAWRTSTEYNLIVSWEAIRSSAELWGLPPGDSVQVVGRIADDISPRNNEYPFIAVERGAADPIAFQGYAYRIIGYQYLWRIVPHPSGRGFTVRGVEEISSEGREAQLRAASEFPIDWYVTAPREPDGSAIPIEPLCRELIEMEKRRALARDVESKRFDLVERWESIFRLQRQVLADPATSIDYSDWEDSGDLLRVTLRDEQSRLPLWRPGDQLSMTSRRQGNFVPVGQLVGSDASVAIIRPDPGRALPELARSGKVAPDRSLEYGALRKQQDALTAIRKGTAVNPALPGILCATNPPGAVEAVPVDRWIQTELDDAKRTAVCLALGTQDVVLIQGPPGTGKTVAIAELILQILRREPKSRILLVSQSHVALDQALERVARAAPDVPMSRLSRTEEKVSLFARDWLLSKRTEEWRESVLARSRRFLDSIGLDPSQALPTAAARTLLDEIVELRPRIETLQRARMAPLSRLSAAKRRKRQDADATNDARAELELIDQELGERREERETAVTLLREFLESHKLSVEGEPDTWGEHLTAIAASEALKPQSELAGLWDEWRRQFGRGIPYEAALAKRSRVLAGTCLGSAGHPSVGRGEFDWVIVDEAGRATPPEILVPLLRGRRAVLVGDHRQLPPVVDRELPSSELDDLGLTRADLEQSLFQLLFESLPVQNTVTLDTQYRMDSTIAELVSDVFYAGRLKSGARQSGFRPEWPPKALTWISTSRLESHAESRRGTSFVNPAEIRVTRQVLERWRQSSMDAGARPTVGVITGYEEHKRALERELDTEDQARWAPLAIEVNTVDAFQGRERDLIIYNAVRSNVTADIGFLGDVRRVNVALSRGRNALVIVGDAEMLRLAQGRGTGTAPFKAILDWIRANSDRSQLIVEKT
jgi:serine/threonine protein kinase